MLLHFPLSIIKVIHSIRSIHYTKIAVFIVHIFSGRYNIKVNDERRELQMKVRMAEERDIPRIHDLLSQVALVHHKGRPDLFKYGQRKYTDDQLK